MKFISPRITLQFEDAVLKHFADHRQRFCCSRESGGQLFGKVTPGAWTVVLATGPRSSDRRTKWSFKPDRSAEREEIQRLFQEGMHYLGDWHTHPQSRPQPSHTDLKSMREMAAQ